MPYDLLYHQCFVPFYYYYFGYIKCIWSVVNTKKDLMCNEGTAC